MYVLMNTFNNCPISRHRTLKGAAKGLYKFNKEFKKHNGKGCYTTTEVYELVGKRLVRLSADMDELFSHYYYDYSTGVLK